MAAAIPRELPAINLDKLTAKRQLPLLPAPRAFATCKQLRRISQLLQLELDLIGKIRYKQKNQHRSATWWRHVAGAHKLVARLQSELSRNLLPLLPDGRDAKSAVYAQTVNRLAESTLRLMALSEIARTAYRKAAAAVQQLLRVALFMPLALTMKAIIARFDSLTSMLEQELPAFMTLLQDSAGRDTTALERMQKHVGRLPKELSRLYTAAKPQSRASQNRSRRRRPTPEAVDYNSANQAPAALPAQSNVSQREPPAEVRLAPIYAEEASIKTATDVAVRRKRLLSDEAGTPQKTAISNLAEDVSKPKKRKKAKPKDDIDMIFAGC